MDDQHFESIEDISVRAVKYVQYGKYEKIKEMLCGGLCSPQAVDSNNCSLLHWAAINDRVDIAKLLLMKGASVNALSSELNENPLQWAVRNEKHLAMTKLLMDAGCDPRHKNLGGFDSLALACYLGNIDISYFL